MSEDRVVEALRALREADGEIEAGPNVELRLMQAVRRRRVRHSWIGAGALVAAMAAAAAVVILLHARPGEPVRQSAPAPQVVAAVAEVAPAAAVVIAKVPRRRARAVRPMPWNLHEVDTQFYPLLAQAPAFERGELVRVTLPASTMRDVGLFVNANVADQPVQADILVGQEGLARAIRFVSFE